MSLNWGGGMAEQRIQNANEKAVMEWLRRQDEEMERRGLKDNNWQLGIALAINLGLWSGIVWLIYFIVHWLSR